MLTERLGSMLIEQAYRRTPTDWQRRAHIQRERTPQAEPHLCDGLSERGDLGLELGAERHLAFKHSNKNW